jgi:hypothetical protein
MWGEATHLDLLSSFFNEIFNKAGLIDVIPDVLVPTWRNGRRGFASISKRLDHVLVAEDLIASVGRYKSWVDYPFFSDHAPVLLRFDKPSFSTAYPFKFNARWLLESEVSIIVTKVWKDLTFLAERDVQQRFAKKMKSLKTHIKAWSKEHLRLQEENLVHLEGLLNDLLMDEAREPHTRDRETKIKLLETEQDNILREEEELWRLRSRVVWLKCGDKNTNFFHNFSSFRRNKNHIWEISDEEVRFTLVWKL